MTATIYATKLKRRHATARAQTRAYKAIAEAAIDLIDLYGVCEEDERIFENVPIESAVLGWYALYDALAVFGIKEVDTGETATVMTVTPTPNHTPTPTPNPTPTPTPNPTPTPTPNPTPTPTPVLGDYMVTQVGRVMVQATNTLVNWIEPVVFRWPQISEASALVNFAAYGGSYGLFNLVRVSDNAVIRRIKNYALEPIIASPIPRLWLHSARAVDDTQVYLCDVQTVDAAYVSNLQAINGANAVGVPWRVSKIGQSDFDLQTIEIVGANVFDTTVDPVTVAPPPPPPPPPPPSDEDYAILELGRLLLASTGDLLGTAKVQRDVFYNVSQTVAIENFDLAAVVYGVSQLVRLSDMAVIKVCNFGVFDAVIASPVPVPTSCFMNGDGSYQVWVSDDVQTVDSQYLTWLESVAGGDWGRDWFVTPLGGEAATVATVAGSPAITFDTSAVVV